MAQWYEVQFTKKLDGNDQHGNVTYSVKFVTEADSVLWTVQPKNAPQNGDKVYGEIQELVSQKGNPYRKFKREQPEEATTGQPQTSVKRTSYTEKQQDKNDEIHQGRCYNNAATIVSSLLINGVVEPDKVKIAQTMQEIAEQLYNMPPLHKNAHTASTEPTEPHYEPEPSFSLNQPDNVYEPTAEELENGPDMSAIDKMFPGNEKVNLQ
jgi:hypothetical protein